VTSSTSDEAELAVLLLVVAEEVSCEVETLGEVLVLNEVELLFSPLLEFEVLAELAGFSPQEERSKAPRPT
jgi:hypothetical protein